MDGHFARVSFPRKCSLYCGDIDGIGLGSTAVCESLAWKSFSLGREREVHRGRSVGGPNRCSMVQFREFAHNGCSRLKRLYLARWLGTPSSAALDTSVQLS